MRVCINKINKKIILFLILFSSLYFHAFASDSYIKNYDMNIKVNKDNTYNITEHISYYFGTPSHGFYRTLLTKSGTNSSIRITDFTCSATIDSIRKTSNSISYVIGDRNRLISGLNEFYISYTYDVGRDQNKGFDAFYFNLVGTEWIDTIQNFNFRVEFPSDAALNKDDISCYLGRYEEVNSSNVQFSVDGAIINGRVNNVRPYVALTLLVPLSDGYFVGARRIVRTELIVLSLLVLFVLTLLILAIIFYFKYGRERFLTPVVSAYPPSGYSPLDVRYLYKKTLDGKGISGAILNFARNGFITITYNKKSSLFSKEQLILKKVKDADSSFSREEKLLFDGLFSEGDEVDTSKPNESFQNSVNSLRASIVALYNSGDRDIYDKKSRKISRVFLLLDIVLIIVELFTFFNVVVGRFVGGNTTFRLVSFCIYIIGVISIAILSHHIKRRSEYYSKMLEQILGLKDFITTVEKEKIQALLNDDPEYFYKTLAYAIPLDVENKWAKKFESLNIKPPQYINGNFDMGSFIIYMYISNMLNNAMMMQNLNNTINMATRNLGGGGLHMGGGGIGGGFSGGGFGGGGGGRW